MNFWLSETVRARYLSPSTRQSPAVSSRSLTLPPAKLLLDAVGADDVETVGEPAPSARRRRRVLRVGRPGRRGARCEHDEEGDAPNHFPKDGDSTPPCKLLLRAPALHAVLCGALAGYSRAMRRSIALVLAIAGTSACGNRTDAAASSSLARTATADTNATASASTVAMNRPAPSASTLAAPSASESAAPSATPTPPDGMVMIPPGFYLMGGGGIDDQPIHEVAVASFFLEKTEVTMDAYQACVDAKKCAPPKEDNPFCNAKLGNRGKHPVNCIDYHQADAYCAFRDDRVPTEREWEYAARGGSEQRLYSWGDDDPTDKRACYMHPGGSCEVASFAPGAFGLYDMSGNVWEWTSTYFGAYPDEPATGQFRVYRGGSWSRRFPKWLRNDLRNRFAENEEGAHLGVRCARSITPIVCPTDAEAKGDHCVRTSGKAMDPSELMAAKIAKAEGSGNVGGPAGSSTSAATDAAGSAWANEAPVKIRSPEFDEDCKHYPGFPTGYTFRGGKFQDREPIVAGSGCKKRDIGVGWTSVCCPG